MHTIASQSEVLQPLYLFDSTRLVLCVQANTGEWLEVQRVIFEKHFRRVELEPQVNTVDHIVAGKVIKSGGSHVDMRFSMKGLKGLVYGSGVGTLLVFVQPHLHNKS